MSPFHATDRLTKPCDVLTEVDPYFDDIGADWQASSIGRRVRVRNPKPSIRAAKAVV